jgi:hypothetical protein
MLYIQCYSCLEPFQYDFVQGVGVRTCIAPYLDSSCNHNSACIADCVTQSCTFCVDTPSTEQCDTEAESGGCATYVQGDACVTQALDGAGSLCNPNTYQGNYGAWLQAVGAAYCGE